MEALKNTIKNLKEFKTYFIYAFLFGFVVNSQALFFNTDATDSLRAYGSTRAEVGSGRFIGHLLDILFENLGFYQSFRFINVLLYLVFAAAAAALVVLIFEIKNKLFAVLIMFLIMSSAVSSGILAYFYVSHMYGLVFFLSVLSSYLLLKKDFVLLPVFLISLSLGIYQAFLPTTILVIFLYQYLKLLEENNNSLSNLHAWLKKTLLYGFVTMAGLTIYLLSNRFYLKFTGESISGYAGMGENVLPDFTISRILSFVSESYRLFFSSGFSDEYFISDNLIIRLCLIFSLLILLFEIFYILRSSLKERQWVKTITLSILSVLLPLFINLPMLIMTDVGERASLNWYFLFIIPITFYEHLGIFKNLKATLGRYVICILICVFSFISIGYSSYRNVNIYSSYIKVHEIAKDLVLEIEERIEHCEGFKSDDEVIFVGALDTQSINRYFLNEEYEEFLYRVFNRDHSSIFRRYALHSFNIIIPGDERIKEFTVNEFNEASRSELKEKDFFCVNDVHTGLAIIHSSLNEIQKMPSYPLEGSVKKINGIVVCKLGE